MFFYLRLCHESENRNQGRSGTDAFVGFVNYIVELYGIRRFLTDIDRDRDFYANGEHVVSAALDWAANEGFYDFFSHHVQEWMWQTAHEYRQRHVLSALKQIRMF